METKLSGGAKFGYLALGFFLWAVGVLIAWLVNKDKPVMKEAIKFSIIGAVITTVLSIIYIVFIFVIVGALAASGALY